MSSRRRGSPRRSVVDYRPATTMASPPDLPKLDAMASGMPAVTSAVTPAVAATRGFAGESGIPSSPPRPLADLVGETVRRVPPGADAFLPRRHDERTGLVDQDQGSATPLAMADLVTALSTFREPLLAYVSRVMAASPAGSAQDAPHRDSRVDTRKSRSKGKTRRHRSPSSSSSSTSSSPSPATIDNDDDRVGRKVGSGKLAVLECPNDRFAGVLNCSGSCPQSQRGITPSENPAQDADRYARVTTRTPGSLGAKRTKMTEATQTQR